MINELYGLARALEQAGIVTERLHPKYKLIPKVTKKAPCVQLILENGRLYQVESIEDERAAGIRKYGSKQGTFPAMNLASLYRLTDVEEKKRISELIEGKTTEFELEEIRRLCRENNWGKKFGNKYRICMKDVPCEILRMFQKAGIVFEPLQSLIGETEAFLDAAYLHRELERIVFAMLEQKREIAFALKILFYFGKQEKSPEEDYGTLSIVWDSRKLIKAGRSVATIDFTEELNRKLVEAYAAEGEAKEQGKDAFGQAYIPLEEPMPTVKLPAGFEASLRTMFRGQPCQTRYGRIENATYPISKEMRFKLQAALAWMSSEEHRGVTWISTDKDEVLFAYPEMIPRNKYSLVKFCKRQKEADKDGDSGSRIKFESAAREFIREILESKQPGTDPMSEHIQYFVLRKLDKMRTKVVYSYNTSPSEIERCSEEWSSGCRNLPKFLFGQPDTIFPMDVSDVLNKIWRQDGKLSTEKYKPVPCYHGMQLLFGMKKQDVRRDLSALVEHVINLVCYLGKTGIARNGYDSTQIFLVGQTRKTLALMGLLLYQLEIRKESYMKGFPYLFGQLLSLSDTLHELYCRIERNNSIPNSLAGSALYASGMEQPYKTLAILGQRMNPYITWARCYRAKNRQKDAEESGRVEYCLFLYEKLSDQLCEAWGEQTRFTEEEKALYFMGYLAALPGKRKVREPKDGGELKKIPDEENTEVQ